MLISQGNISEYNELMKMSVEDYILRFKMFIDDIKIERKKSNG